MQPRQRLSARALLNSASASAALLATLGCPEFNRDLYLDAEADVESWAAIEDFCPLPEEKLLDSDTRVHAGVVFLNDLADDYQDIGKLTDMDGPEGILGFRVASNERVALSAQFALGASESPPPIDLALWLTRACDTNAFVRRNQRCPLGVGETMWWQTNEPGAFYLGFDSKAYDESFYAPQVELSVVYPRFGDGVLDPGETCDDGNLVDGDGCTHDGLAEIEAVGGNPSQEVEPNNHPTAGNIVSLAAGEMIQIVGFIGGSCDNDFFLMPVPEGSFPRVTILRADGRECDESTPQFRLEFNQTLFDNQEQAKLGDAPIPALEGTGTNYCPQWDENTFAIDSLAAGQYVAEFKAFNQGQHEAFHYLMRIEMLEPLMGE